MQIMAKEDYIIPEKNILPKKEFIGLTDDEIASVIKKTFPVNTGVTNVDLKYARAIEQALKEKNHG
jgi:hypothetical protein